VGPGKISELTEEEAQGLEEWNQSWEE
jgi:hypothetical protein